MKTFRLVLYDAGMQVHEWDVALGMPNGYGWNLSMKEGRDGLIAELLAVMHEGKAEEIG